MNLRRFYMIITVALTVFLFVTGSGILFYIKSLGASETTDVKTAEKSSVNDLLKSFVIGKDPVNFLFLVGDKEEANTDTMMIVNYNPATNKLSVLSIPRDTKVNISGSIPKVNSIYARKNGSQLLLSTLNSFLGINIKYYVYLNITTFRKIIDLLGGVDYDVPINMDYDDPIQNLHIHLKKGKQHFDGIKAEQFLRFRHPNGSNYSQEMIKFYDGSDIKRIEAQQNFIKELIKQKVSLKYLPKLNDIINTVYSNLETNITLNEIIKLLKNVSNFSMENVNMFTLPGTSDQESGIWYYICDKQETAKIIKEYFNAKGGTANTVSPTTKSSTKTTNTAPAPTKAPVSSAGSTTVKKPADSVTKDAASNPSNTGTSVQGSTNPAP